jgi:hypothetical protein
LSFWLREISSMKNITQPTSEILHRQLGIPEEAKRVLIFSESSHWDPNWMFTSDEYFDRFVRSNLDQAIEELLQEPRRIYSIECVFFLRLYWDRCPAQREKVRALVNEGRLRLTSSGVTTADTLLPSTEAILRDLLIGQEWLRTNGMHQEPKLAYFSDSFGCSPALPSLLNAAGFDRTAITRIDGMYFMGCDLELTRNFPRPGSSAHLLMNQERSLDFLWRDRNGAQILCHWNAFSYGQGDMLAYVGLSRVYLARFALPARSDRHIANRIRQFVDQLAPYSRTPYMFCPIGFDFVEPIPDLVALLDRYNRNHYSTTGIWTANAGLDDYLELVEGYQDKLPVIELDPNPYWTGFYTSRPALKKQCHELVEDLLLAERLSFLPEHQRANQTISKELESAWWSAAVSNHHDFITGTSPDRVVEEEQLPWLEQASTQVKEVTQRLAATLPTPGVETKSSQLPEWSCQAGHVRIKTTYYIVEMLEEIGGAISSIRGLDAPTSTLTGITNDLVSYRDSGGLWRMGLEFWGGTWKKSMQASQRLSRLQISERDDGLEITCITELNGEVVRRKMWLRNDSPIIHFRVEGRAAEGHSVTVRIASGLSTSELIMDTPGGVVVRPLNRIYNPTFWNFQKFVHVQDDNNGRGLAVLLSNPGAVSYQPDGSLELVALRNATREKAFVFIPIPGNPASGHERTDYAFDYALLFTRHGDWRENDIDHIAGNSRYSPWDKPTRAALDDLSQSVITTDCPEVRVLAVKPASRGEGVIVRLYAPEVPQAPVMVTGHHLEVKGALLCDARERDLEPLEVRSGSVRVAMPGTVASIRFLLD